MEVVHHFLFICYQKFLKKPGGIIFVLEYLHDKG